MLNEWEILAHDDPRVIETAKLCNGEFAEETLEDVKNGYANAYKTHRGILIARADGKELVGVSFFGKNGRAALQELKKIAKQAGFKTLRLHSETVAIGRLYNIGEPSEYIWRVPLED